MGMGAIILDIRHPDTINYITKHIVHIVFEISRCL